MRHLMLHSAPIYPGEDPLVIPDSNDYRTQALQWNLRRLGLMDAEGYLSTDADFRRGIRGGCYFWEVEWEDDDE